MKSLWLRCGVLAVALAMAWLLRWWAVVVILAITLLSQAIISFRPELGRRLAAQSGFVLAFLAFGIVLLVEGPIAAWRGATLPAYVFGALLTLMGIGLCIACVAYLGKVGRD
jgi:hypothetical protein